MTGTMNKLKTLFDFQRFEGESRLQGVIDDTIKSSHGMKMLSDDELENAAGGAGGGDNENEITLAYCPYCSEDPLTGEKVKREIELYSGGRGYCRSCNKMIDGM